MPSYLYYIIFLCLISVNSFPQRLDENNFIRYTKLEGLSNNNIIGISQDSTGYIWIATNKGLNRFDGKSFVNFFENAERTTLPENTILAQRQVDKNEIVCGTRSGAFSFNTVTYSSKHFIVPVDSILFFWANQAWDVIKDVKGNYILSTKSGLFVFNHQKKIIQRYDQHASTDAGRMELWFGGWLSSLSNGKVFHQNGLIGSLYDPATNHIDTLFAQKQQRLRLSLIDKQDELRVSFPGRNNKIFIVNNEENSVLVYDLVSGLSFSSSFPNSLISGLGWSSKLFYLNDSLLAITGNQSGFYLFHFNPDIKKLIYSGERYFPAKFCTAILNDSEGRLWVGTKDGLFKQNKRFAFFDSDDLSLQHPSLLNTPINCILVEANELFVGLQNEGGLLLLDKDSKKLNRQYSFKKYGEGSNTINFIFSYHRDTLWLGTQNGIVWLNRKNNRYGKLYIPGQPAWMNQSISTLIPVDPATKIRLREPGVPDWISQNKTRFIFEDSRKNIWISFGKLNSLVMFDRVSYKFIDYSYPVSPLLKITFCFSMIEDKKGNIWLAGDGLCRWNRNKNMIDTLIPFPSVSNHLTNYMEIFDIDSENNLWLSGSDNEIIQYNCSDNKMWLRLAENNLMEPYHFTNSPIIGNMIWLGQENGFSAFNIKDYSVKQFNYADGLPPAHITTTRRGSFYDKDNNRFYFGARQYLVSLTPDMSISNNYFPKLSLEVLDHQTGSAIKLKSSDIELPYSKNDIQVLFTALNFTDPEENRFAYRVVSNADSSWHTLYSQNSIALSNLEPGTHRLQVKLFSVNNRWPEQLKQLEILVAPPFWKTSWFITIVTILAAAVIYGFYRYRIKQINKQANIDRLLAKTEIKALHAQMNPHFIFNSLNSIMEMVLNDDKTNASRYLSNYAQLIRLNLEHSKQNFITLKENTDYLRLYLDLEHIRTNSFDYTFGVAEDIKPDEILMPPMLIQPFIENSIWYGPKAKNNPMKLDIRFLTDNGQLLCIIDDNGIGIESAPQNKEENVFPHTPSGIANVRQRIEILNEKYKLNCSLNIEDKSKTGQTEESGTKVTLRLPLNMHDL